MRRMPSVTALSVLVSLTVMGWLLAGGPGLCRAGPVIALNTAGPGRIVPRDHPHSDTDRPRAPLRRGTTPPRSARRGRPGGVAASAIAASAEPACSVSE